MAPKGEARRVLTARVLAVAAVVTVTIALLPGTASAATFENPAPIVIPGPPAPPGCPTFTPPAPANNSCPATPALLYPSAITVSDLSGTITDVNITLRGFNVGAPFDGRPGPDNRAPDDLDVLLQAPDGKTVMLISDVCANEGPQDPADITLDDSATAQIPINTACVTGTFKPFDDDKDNDEFPFTAADSFPPPAPPPANNTLSSLNGSNANGTWNLWVVDDTPGAVGPTGAEFSRGWTMALTTSQPDTTTTVGGLTPTGGGSTTPTTVRGSTTPTTVAGGGTPIANTGVDSRQPLTGALLITVGWAMVALSRRPEPVVASL